MKKISLILLTGILAFVIYSCGDDPVPPKPTKPQVSISNNNVKLKVSETSNITISNYDSLVIVNNPNIATIEKLSETEYRITGKKVGQTFILIGSQKCNIEISRYYNYFRDPHLSWGEGKNTVKENEQFRILEKDEPNVLVYKDNLSQVMNYLFYRFNNEYKLYSIKMYILAEKDDELSNYLNDYYIPKTETHAEYTLYSSPLPKSDLKYFDIYVSKVTLTHEGKDYRVVELVNPIYVPSKK